MNSLLRTAAGAAVALGLAGPAAASELYYTFDFSGAGVTASGLLITSGTTDPAAPFAGGYDILSVSGMMNDAAITGLLGSDGPAAYSPDGYFIYDNDFYAAGSASAAGGYFDDDGMLFTVGTASANLFFDGTTYWDWADQGGGIAVSFSAVDPPPPQIPEPATGLVLATGLMVLLLVARRRTRPGRAR